METKVLDECQNRQNCWMNTKQATRTVEIDQDRLAVKKILSKTLFINFSLPGQGYSPTKPKYLRLNVLRIDQNYPQKYT